MAEDDEITIEFDEDSSCFYTVWRPLVSVGRGETQKEALEDLREAAHFGVETAVNIKLSEIVNARKKED